jgi:hypothetical protein
MWSRIFNLAIWKVVFALAIPIGIAAFWLYSQHEANVEVEDYKKAQKADPNTDRITVTHYELKEVDDENKVRWQLTAKDGVFEPVHKDVALNQVTMEYFDGDKCSLRLSAPKGSANETTRYVELDATPEQKVFAAGEGDKAQLIAQKVELTKKNQFLATGDVNILWPGVAKVTGDSAAGSLAKGAAFDHMKITGNTHALIGLK